MSLWAKFSRTCSKLKFLRVLSLSMCVCVAIWVSVVAVIPFPSTRVGATSLAFSSFGNCGHWFLSVYGWHTVASDHVIVLILATSMQLACSRICCLFGTELRWYFFCSTSPWWSSQLLRCFQPRTLSKFGGLVPFFGCEWKPSCRQLSCFPLQDTGFFLTRFCLLWKGAKGTAFIFPHLPGKASVYRFEQTCSSLLPHSVTLWLLPDWLTP